MDLDAIVPLAILAVFVAAGAWSDMKERKLSNGLCLATLASGLVIAIMSKDVIEVLSHLGHFAVALGIGVALFGAGFWGGGDGKFYAAVAAWFPLSGFFTLLFAISLMGLALVAAMTVRARGRLFAKTTNGIPYGLAIGLGALLALGQWVI